jgi:hypothetical protein
VMLYQTHRSAFVDTHINHITTIKMLKAPNIIAHSTVTD